MNVSEHVGEEELVQAAIPIVEAASNILDVSSNVSTYLPSPSLMTVMKQPYWTVCLSQREVSDLLLKGMDSVQSALLNGKKVDEASVIVNSPHITVFVNR